VSALLAEGPANQYGGRTFGEELQLKTLRVADAVGMNSSWGKNFVSVAVLFSEIMKIFFSA